MNLSITIGETSDCGGAERRQVQPSCESDGVFAEPAARFGGVRIGAAGSRTPGGGGFREAVADEVVGGGGDGGRAVRDVFVVKKVVHELVLEGDDVGLSLLLRPRYSTTKKVAPL